MDEGLCCTGTHRFTPLTHVTDRYGHKSRHRHRVTGQRRPVWLAVTSVTIGSRASLGRSQNFERDREKHLQPMRSAELHDVALKALISGVDHTDLSSLADVLHLYFGDELALDLLDSCLADDLLANLDANLALQLRLTRGVDPYPFD